MTSSDVDPLWVFSDWRTEYVSDGRTLTGFFVAPDGDGPFPGVVFHHGSNGLMAEAKLGLLELVGMGYAVFVPDLPTARHRAWQRPWRLQQRCRPVVGRCASIPSALGAGRRCTLRAVITESGVDF